MAPQHYLDSTYFEHWLDGDVRNLIEKGVITAEEMSRREAFFAANPGTTSAPAPESPPFERRKVPPEGYRRAVGIKNVTFNEPYFQGHWPESPIMPGVLQLEAMAQLAGVLLLRKLENTGKLAVLWSIDKVKLRGTVVPGDQLRIEVETIKVKPSLGQVTGRCKVGGRLVSEATLMFTLVDA